MIMNISFDLIDLIIVVYFLLFSDINYYCFEIPKSFELIFRPARFPAS